MILYVLLILLCAYTVHSNWYRLVVDGTVGWNGGECTCPDGSTYLVGDNMDNCSSLACEGGKSGACYNASNPSIYSQRKVTCQTPSPNATGAPQPSPRPFGCGTEEVYVGPWVGIKVLSYNTAGLSCLSPCTSGCVRGAQELDVDIVFKVTVGSGTITLQRLDAIGDLIKWSSQIYITCYRNLSCTPVLPDNRQYRLAMAGNNFWGQLGIGKTDLEHSFTPQFNVLLSPNGKEISDVALGWVHSTFLAGQQLFVFGGNMYGQLGLGHTADEYQPVLLVPPNGQTVTLVSCGAQHTLLIAGGDLFTTGNSDYGQLCLGDTTSYSSLQHVLSPYGQPVDKVHAGPRHSSFIAGGLFFVCGMNSHGELGTGDTEHVLSPYHLQAPNNASVTGASIGLQHLLFVAGGMVYGTGDNSFGQLGLGLVTQVLKPYAVAPRLLAQSVSSGVFHSGILSTNGTLYATGNNDRGQLGLGDNRTRTSFQAVALPGGHPVTRIAFGDYSALLAGGQLYVAGFRQELSALTNLPSTNTFHSMGLLPNGQPAVAMHQGWLHVAIMTSLTYTPTLSPTQSSTLSPSTIPTPTYTGTATNTKTNTLTTVPTRTTTFTNTALLPVCGEVDNVTRSLEFQGPGICVRHVILGPGSTWAIQRKARLELIELSDGKVTLHLEEGCTAKGPQCPQCSDCIWKFYPEDIGSTKAVALDTVPLVQGLVIFESGTNSAQRTLRVVKAGIVPTSGASAILLVLVCCVTALGSVVIALFVWLLLQRHIRSIPFWKVNPKLTRVPVGLALFLAFSFLLIGVAWCVTAFVAASDSAGGMADAMGGIVLLVVGAVTFILLVLWVMHDPEQYICFVCENQVSRWRFFGVYLPDPSHGDSIWKAHTAHVRCLVCGKIVTSNRWAEGPNDRPYHSLCWDSYCMGILESETADFGSLSDVECVHLLGMAVRSQSLKIIHDLLQLHPGLQTLPITGEKGMTALHIATQCSSAALEALLEYQPGMLDPPPVVRNDAQPDSLFIHQKRLDTCDVYICHRFLTYNSRPVFIGRHTGYYLYWYQPYPEDKVQQTPGWCLSPYLGSGTSAEHVYLDSDPAVVHQPAVTKPKGRKKKFPCPPRHHHKHFPGAFKRLLSPPAVDDEKESKFLEEEPETLAIPIVAAHEVRKVPHMISLMHSAVSSGNLSLVQTVAELCSKEYADVLTWRWPVGKALWDYHNRQTGIPNKVSQAVMPTLFQFSNPTTGKWEITDSAEAVQDWTSAAVLMDGLSLAAIAPDFATLKWLCKQGHVDYSMWCPPCTQSEAMKVAGIYTCSWIQDIIDTEVCTAMDSNPVPSRASQQAMRLERNARRQSLREAGTGIGSRLMDGLQEPLGTAEYMPFYSPDYVSTIGTLPFCGALPCNPLGLNFSAGPLLQMGADTLMKVGEMQRHGCSVSACHITSIYVYTYELPTENGEGDQIYGAMNAAMRVQDAQAIRFWKPLIWHIAVALECLPTFSGKLFRGINCRFSTATYRPGQLVCWRSFSSASQSQSVAESFTSSSEGTLFFLQSMAARPISAFSRFPEEEEVLFGPNTMFQVTSVLHATSDIGSFYSKKVDNVAMEEWDAAKTGDISLGIPGMTGLSHVVISMPKEIFPTTMMNIQKLPGTKAETVALPQAKEDSVAIRVFLQPSDPHNK